MDTITQIMINRTYDKKLKYEEQLRKIEQIKTEMGERYLLHPANNVSKKEWHDIVRDSDVPFYLRRDNTSLVIDGWETWGDEARLKAIAQNGNTGEHYYGEL